MRSTLVTAAFAAGALAVPYHERRAQAPPSYDNVDVVYDVVYVTNIVTVTAGAEAPAFTPEVKHYGHKHSKPVTTTTTEEAAPAYTPQTTSEAAPVSAPETTSEAAPAYVPETTSEAPAPPPYEAPSSTYEAPAAESSASSPSAPASDSYEDICLYHHNIHRANHSVPDLVWSDSLAATAQKIADTCIYAHNTEVDGGGYGQNIAAGVEKSNVSAIITDLFYNAEEPLFANNYGADDPDMTNFELWGHFTQIVWKDTTEVGCATSENCQSLANTGSGVSPYFTVCNYKNPGNYAGKYADNVKRPESSGPSVSWDAGIKALLGYKK